MTVPGVKRQAPPTSSASGPATSSAPAVPSSTAGSTDGYAGTLSAESFGQPDVSALGAGPAAVPGPGAGGQPSLLRPVTGLLGGLTGSLSGSLGATPLGPVVGTIGGLAGGGTGLLDGALTPGSGAATGLLGGLTGGAVGGLLRPVTGQLGGLSGTIGGLTSALPLDSVPILGKPISGLLGGAVGSLDGAGLGGSNPLGLGALSANPNPSPAQAQYATNTLNLEVPGRNGDMLQAMTAQSQVQGQGERVVKDLGGGRYLTDSGRVVQILHSASTSGAASTSLSQSAQAAGLDPDAAASALGGDLNAASVGEKVIKDLGNGQYLTTAGRVVQILATSGTGSVGGASGLLGGTAGNVGQGLGQGLSGALDNAQSRLNGLPVAGELGSLLGSGTLSQIVGNGANAANQYIQIGGQLVSLSSILGQLGQGQQGLPSILEQAQGQASAQSVSPLPGQASVLSSPLGQAQLPTDYQIQEIAGGRPSDADGGPVAAWMNGETTTPTATGSMSMSYIVPSATSTSTGTSTSSIPGASSSVPSPTAMPDGNDGSDGSEGATDFEMAGLPADYWSTTATQGSSDPYAYGASAAMANPWAEADDSSAVTHALDVGDGVEGSDGNGGYAGGNKWQMGWAAHSTSARGGADDSASPSTSASVSPSASASASASATAWSASSAVPTATSSSLASGSVIWSGASTTTTVSMTAAPAASSDGAGEESWGDFVSA